MDCSKTDIFLQEWDRMCSSYNQCSECDVYKKFDGNIKCVIHIKNHWKQILEIVQKWSNEHQPKTRQSEFLGLFPNAKMLNGVLDLCPKSADTKQLCKGISGKTNCHNCKESYWLSEVE